MHGDDIVRTIREALREDRFGAQAVTQSEVRMTPNAVMGWPNRDGKLEFDCIHRDWFRAYRVTVEALPDIEDFVGELGSDEWVVVE